MSAGPEVTFYVELGRRIRGARKAKGWTQRQLANRMDCTPTAISYWESATHHPSLFLVRQMERLFGEPLA